MRARRGPWVAARAVMMIAAGLAAASPAEMTSKDRAYTLTLMCAAFAGVAGKYGTDADVSRTQQAVDKMGRAQGYSSERVFHEIVTMAAIVQNQIRDDPKMIDRNRAICRKIKLMD